VLEHVQGDDLIERAALQDVERVRSSKSTSSAWQPAAIIAATLASEWSRPITEQPSVRAIVAKTPGPQPTSRIVELGRTDPPPLRGCCTESP